MWAESRLGPRRDVWGLSRTFGCLLKYMTEHLNRPGKSALIFFKKETFNKLQMRTSRFKFPCAITLDDLRCSESQ